MGVLEGPKGKFCIALCFLNHILAWDTPVQKGTHGSTQLLWPFQPLLVPLVGHASTRANA